MFYSIVIPEYNFDCTPLVKSLIPLCKDAFGDDYEILVVDDCSCDDIRDTLRIVNLWERCKLIEKPENTGRACTRNIGVLNAKGDYVFFMDCDAEIASVNFFKNYLKVIHAADVTCGGLRISLSSCRDDNHLRYRYETIASTKQKKGIPQKHPYESFTAFNVCIRKSVFNHIMFNEEFSQYGYEDVLFGIDLRKHQIPIQHIFNPLTHTGLDDNTSFLKKTEESLRNLHRFQTLFEGETNLLRKVKLIENLHLTLLVRFLHLLFRRAERNNLLGKRPLLTIFKLYKLGYFLNLPKRP